MHYREFEIFTAIHDGAIVCLLKKDAFTHLIPAVAAANAGISYFNPFIRELVAQSNVICSAANHRRILEDAPLNN
jgi:DNA-binding NarL/FixJ family response regulator